MLTISCLYVLELALLSCNTLAVESEKFTQLDRLGEGNGVSTRPTLKPWLNNILRFVVVAHHRVPIGINPTGRGNCRCKHIRSLPTFLSSAKFLYNAITCSLRLVQDVMNPFDRRVSCHGIFNFSHDVDWQRNLAGIPTVTDAES